MSILHKIFTKAHLGAFLNWFTDGFVAFWHDLTCAFVGAGLLTVLRDPKTQTYLIDSVFISHIASLTYAFFILWAGYRIITFTLDKILDKVFEWRNGSDIPVVSGDSQRIVQ